MPRVNTHGTCNSANGCQLFLRHIAGAPPGPAPTDAELLGRYVRDRDPAAFELLVWRHQRMVFAVCRRVLRDRHDAEDAFQATFLTLVRKAGSISKRQALAGWLYQVAYRIACRARADLAKHAKREQTGADLADAPDTHATAANLQPSEIWPLIDSELQRLPAKYRDPVVLCYLEGKTYDQAASQLGCPVGTLSTRLTTARELLRERLTRRGVAISAGALAVHFGAPHATAASIALVAETIKVGTTGSAVSANVTALTKGVIQAMFLTKLKSVVGITVAFAVIGAGGVALVPDRAPTALAQPGGSGGQSPIDPAAMAQPPRAPQTWHLNSTITAPEAYSVLALSPNGKLLAAAGGGSEAKTVRLWDVATGKEIAALVGKPQKVRAMAFSPDGKILCTAGEASNLARVAKPDGREGPFGDISLWDVATQQHLDTIFDEDGPILAARFGEDRRAMAGGALSILILDTVNATGSTKVWVVPTGRLKEIRALTKQDVGTVAFSPDGKQLAIGKSNGGVVLVGAHSGKAVRELGVEGLLPTALAYSADGKLLATTGRRIKSAVADPATGKLVGTFGGQDVMVWDTASGKLLLKLPAATDTVQIPVDPPTKWANELLQLYQFPAAQGIAFSPDGKLLATPGQDTVRLWDVATGKETAVLQGFKGPVVVILFAPDGGTLITGSGDRTIRFWSIQPKDPETLMWECKYIRAGDAAARLREFIAGEQDKRVGFIIPHFITVDDRSNRVFVSGSPGIIAFAKKFMQRVDKADAPGLPAGARLDGLLSELLKSPRTNEQIIEALCLATLSRLPTDVETQLMLKQVADKKDRHEAFADVLRAFVRSQSKRPEEVERAARQLLGIELADKQFKARMTEWVAGKTTVDLVLSAQTQLMSARMAVAKTRNEREAVLAGFLESTWIVWRIYKTQYEAGTIPSTQYAQAGTQLEEARALAADLLAKD